MSRFWQADRVGRLSEMRLRWRRSARWKRVALTTALVLVVAVLVPAGAAAIALRVEYAGDPSAQARTRGRDAVWLGHAWVDGRKTDADVDALARQVAGTGIRDLYVHTGPLERDGTLLASRYPQADWFVAAVRRTMPKVRVQAWLGTVVRPQQDGLDLDDRLSRDRVVWSSAQVLNRGFDGVHLDLEPVRSGSPGFPRPARPGARADPGPEARALDRRTTDRSGARPEPDRDGGQRASEVVDPRLLRRGSPAGSTRSR